MLDVNNSDLKDTGIASFVQIKICRCSQIVNEIPLNTHSYYTTALETLVTTISLLYNKCCFKIVAHMK